MATDFTASQLYPTINEQVDFVVTGKTFPVPWSVIWVFYDQFDNRVYPTFINGNNNTVDISVSFDDYGPITCIFKAQNGIVPSTPPPDPPPTDDAALVQIVKHDYLQIISSHINYVYSLTSPSLDSVMLTTNGTRDVAVKVTQLNPLTLLEDTLSPIEGTQVNGYVTLTGASEDYSITFAEDGVYFIYCQYGNIITKHIFVNIKTILEYIDATALENICCSSNSVVNYPSFSQKDYIFNVISNLVYSFLGIELSNIEFNYGELTDYSTLYADKIYECVSVGGTTPAWTLDNILCVETVSGVALNSNSHMIEGNTYRCLSTGVPSSFGGDVISAYTTTLDTQLKDMSEIIYKVNQYLIGNDNISC